MGPHGLRGQGPGGGIVVGWGRVGASCGVPLPPGPPGPVGHPRVCVSPPVPQCGQAARCHQLRPRQGRALGQGPGQPQWGECRAFVLAPPLFPAQFHPRPGSTPIVALPLPLSRTRPLCWPHPSMTPPMVLAPPPHGHTPLHWFPTPAGAPMAPPPPWPSPCDDPTPVHDPSLSAGTAPAPSLPWVCPLITAPRLCFVPTWLPPGPPALMASLAG